MRIAGNIVNDDILGSMEYACKVAGSRLIVVLGHTHCGAIKGACAEVKMDHLSGLLEKIKPAVDNVTRCCQHELDENEKVLRVAEENVALTVNAIPQQSAILRAMISSGEIGIVGAMYDIETGRVRFFSEV
ncbi:carbonic anhydrase [Methylocucumis oryzae]|uniref:carbonic anhydrase n=1 Tax=Methylocucumis oryzae TaxID=1632867 RepID=UPI000A7A9473|nr:carbonic anhydrase [Methylocucumis oryzae]